MGDTLKLFGKTYSGVNGIKAYDENGFMHVYTKDASQAILVPKSITQNGTYDPSSDNADGYSEVTVNVPSSGGTYQAKTGIVPTTSSQTITPDSGYDALSSVQINAMPSGTAGTPTATKGAVNNHSITVTPSVTNTTGYITGGTKTGTGVTVSASELVSGTMTILENMTGLDVTNYATVDVDVRLSPAIYQNKTGIDPSEASQTITADAGFDALASVQINRIPESYVGSGITRRSSSDLTASGATVTAPAGYYGAAATKTVASGSATAPASISGTSATVSTGTNTLTLSKTVSVTPSVTAGYISSGTATNSSVSLTASITTQAAQTIHPSTTDQSIAASRYLTGAQTVKAVTMSNLTAANIKKDVVVKIGDSTDDDCVTSITGTYEGGGASNVVTGTFKGTTTGAAMDVTLNYTGSGYPVAVVIYPTGGAYNSSAPSGSNAYNWYNLVKRYSVAVFTAVKTIPDQVPFQGITNKATTATVYKNSSSDATSYQRSSSMETNTFGGNSMAAQSSNSRCVVFKSATTMSVFIASTSYGFAANIEYTYHVLYSS